MRVTTLAAVLGVFSFAVSICAQPPTQAFDSLDQRNKIESQCKKEALLSPAYYYCTEISYFLAPTKASDRNAGLDALSRPSVPTESFANAIVLESTIAQVSNAAQYEAQRLDKQLGAPPSADSSANLVSKPGVAQLLSIAVESGALTKTQSGNTTTLQGNLDRLTRFLIGADQGSKYTTRGTPVLQNISVSSTLTLNAPTTSAIPTSGSATSSTVAATTAAIPSTATKLASISARYQYHNKYDPRSPAFQQAYAASLTLANAASPANSLNEEFADVASCEGYSASDSVADTIKKFNKCFEVFLTKGESNNSLKLDDIAQKAYAVEAVTAANLQTYRNAMVTAAGVPFTFEYVYNRPANQPDTHDFRGVLAWTVGAGILNANVAGSFYGSQRPANASYGRFRDVQLAAEFDRAFSSSASSPSWSLAGYGQWQSSPSVIVLTATSVPAGITLPANAQSFITGTQGWLAVVQGKITFKVGSMQIPASAKWSNKTDLLDKSSFGGQFGINYDLSQLKQLFGRSL